MVQYIPHELAGMQGSLARAMPNEKISMSKLKQLIGPQTSNLGVRELGRALGLSIGAVHSSVCALPHRLVFATLRLGLGDEHELHSCIDPGRSGYTF